MMSCGWAFSKFLSMDVFCHVIFIMMYWLVLHMLLHSLSFTLILGAVSRSQSLCTCIGIVVCLLFTSGLSTSTYAVIANCQWNGRAVSGAHYYECIKSVLYGEFTNQSQAP